MLPALSNGIVYTDTDTTLNRHNHGARNDYVDGTVKKVRIHAVVFPVGADDSLLPDEISAPAVSTESFTTKYFAIRYSAQRFMRYNGKPDDCMQVLAIKKKPGSTNVRVRLW
ncbi:MAG: hypothetical protein IPM91_21310 [Bacteroidetes bacterium]|nr:hypothetical protein [Bacteroidota bacterium]